MRKQAKNGFFDCPCCGYATIEHPGCYDICKICFWEDDSQDDPEADEHYGGPNGCSLTEGRISFLEIGASDSENLKYCQKPCESDIQLRKFRISKDKVIEENYKNI